MTSNKNNTKGRKVAKETVKALACAGVGAGAGAGGMAALQINTSVLDSFVNEKDQEIQEYALRQMRQEYPTLTGIAESMGDPVGGIHPAGNFYYDHFPDFQYAAGFLGLAIGLGAYLFKKGLNLHAKRNYRKGYEAARKEGEAKNEQK